MEEEGEREETKRAGRKPPFPKIEITPLESKSKKAFQRAKIRRKEKKTRKEMGVRRIQRK